MDLDPVAGPLRLDVRSGAAEVAERAAAIFAERLRATDAEDVDALRAAAADVAARLRAAQPAMAPLLALSASVLRALSATASPDAAREQALQAVEDFRRHLEETGREVALRAEVLVPAGGRVLALSNSSMVRESLLEAARRRSFDVLCLESRPNLEGRDFAARLAEAGIGVTLAPDAAVACIIRGCDVVLVGADSIGDLGVVNKIGTRPAALAARSAEIPIYALADTAKLLPAGYPQPPADDRPIEEVWPDPPSGVAIWNRYFEATPLSYFAGVVTEQGLRTADEIEEARAAIRLPAELHRPSGGQPGNQNNGAAGGNPAAP